MKDSSTIVPLGVKLLRSALKSLEIEAGPESNGYLGAAFPDAVAEFHVTKSVLGVRLISEQKRTTEDFTRLSKLANGLNSAAPYGKFLVTVEGEEVSVEYAHHILLAEGVSHLQLCTVLDAFLQIGFASLEELWGRFPEFEVK